MACTFLGPVVEEKSIPCCGGRTTTIQLHACACEEVEQNVCHQTSQVEGAACCRLCKFNTDPPPKTARRKPKGPGSHLKGIFEWWGVEPCEYCEETAAMMDEWGADGCVENMETILDRIGTAAEMRGKPFSRWAAAKLVRIAIKRGRR